MSEKYNKKRLKEIAARFLGTYDEAKRAESVGIEVGEKYRDDFQRAEDTARHGIMTGLLLDKKGNMSFRDKLSYNLMNLQKDEDDASIKGKVKNLIADENIGEESNIDVNNNRFSVALRRQMIKEGNTSEEDFIDRIVNIVQDLREGKQSPEVDGLKLKLSLGLLDEPAYSRYKENILSGETPYSDELNPAPNVGVMKSSRVPLRKPKELKFNKGGAAMEKQMEMAFMQEGGLRDDGMDKDPVSGNDVPSGSLAEEVRDDIPAQLSEGEYVVPADVVRFFGIKFFEDLRMQAKMGLAQMEDAGRIGGEPIEEDEEMLDPEDEIKIIRMTRGFDQGGVSTDEDFKKDAEAKTFDFRKYSTPGGTLFGPSKSKLDGLVTYYHPDGREENVLYVNGKIVNEEQIEFTKPPWSTEEPKSSAPSIGVGNVGLGGDDERGSSNREKDLGGVPTTSPDPVMSSEDLAKKYGGEALYLDKGKTKPLKMTELVYKNLQREYNTLGGDEIFGNFANYYKVPQSEKLNLLFENRFGEKPTAAQVKKILDDSKKKPSFIDAIKKGGLLGLIMKIAGDRTQDITSGVPTTTEPDLTTTEGRLRALTETRDDRPFTAIDSPIYATAKDKEGNPVFVTDALTGQTSRKVTADDLRRYQEDIAKGTPLGDTRVGRNVTKFMQGFQTADERKAKEAGVNVGDPVVFGTKADGSQGFKPVTDKTLSNIEKNRQDVEQRTKDAYSDPTLSLREREKIIHGFDVYGGDTPSVGSAGQDNIGGVSSAAPDITSEIIANKGGLASKPKAKAKRKKNTKGLGTKPKAT